MPDEEDFARRMEQYGIELLGPSADSRLSSPCWRDATVRRLACRSPRSRLSKRA
jgi:hypothetical protein